MSTTTQTPTTTTPALPATPLMVALSDQYGRVMARVDPADVPADPDAAIDRLMSLEVLKKAIGDIYDGVEAARQEFGRAVCERHGSAAWPYRWGTEKDEKARNPLALWPALLDAAKGDEEAALACLSSNAFKVGACRKLLGDAFDVHFETTTKGKLDEATGAKAAAFKLLKANQFNV